MSENQSMRQSPPTQMKEILLDKEISEDVIHYIRDNRRLTAEEEAIYRKKFEIDNSSNNIHYSANIINSNFISHSAKVENSQYIYHSQVISSSEYVYKSNNVKNCTNIDESFNINNSLWVAKSSDITNSSYIVKGKNVQNSTYIHSSSNVQFSHNIYMSESADNCMLSGFLTNCTNCLLCFGIKDKSNMLFNQPVTADISQFYDILRELIEGQNIPMVLHTTNFSKPLTYSMNFKTAVDGFNNSFFEILKRLPYYDEFLVKQIFVR